MPVPDRRIKACDTVHDAVIFLKIKIIRSVRLPSLAFEEPMFLIDVPAACNEALLAFKYDATVLNEDIVVSARDVLELPRSFVWGLAGRFLR